MIQFELHKKAIIERMVFFHASLQRMNEMSQQSNLI
jgi:hypothetical protein